MKYHQPYTLLKRGKIWYYRTYDANGIRTTAKSTGQKTKTAAAQYCDNIVKSGALWTGEQTFELYAKHFFDDDSPYVADRARPLAPATLRLYRTVLANQLLPKLKNTRLTEIKYTYLRQLRIDLQESGLTPGSVQTAFSILKIIIRDAVANDLILRDPFARLTITRIANTERRDAMTESELLRLLQNIPQNMKLYMMMLSLTGMRMSEGLGVSSADIKSENGIRYIDLRQQRLNNVRQDLKNHRPRKIPIIDELADAITSFRMSKSYVYKHMNRIVREFDEAQRRKLCTHSIRHFFISSAKAYGINPLIVEAVAGHTLPGIEGIYTNFSVDDTKQILQWQRQLWMKEMSVVQSLKIDEQTVRRTLIMDDRHSISD